MAEGHHFDSCYMWYLSNNLIDFYEICMAMHTGRSDPIGDQKIENLKSWKTKIADRSHLNSRYLICPISTKFCMVVDLASRPQVDMEKMVQMESWNKILAIKQQICMVKTFQFTTKCKIDC